MSQASLLIETLVQEVQARRSMLVPITLAAQITREYPDAIGDLAIAVMDRTPDGGTYLDDALSFLPEIEWGRVVEHAIQKLEAARDRSEKVPEAAESVLNIASLQCLETVHPYLERLFNLGETADLSAWRESGMLHFDELRQHLESEAETSTTLSRMQQSAVRKKKIRAWTAMLETRTLPVMEWAISHADIVSLSPQVAVYLYEVGFENEEGTLRSLYSETVHHFCFEAGYLPPRPAHTGDHPTFNFVGTGEAQRFGGTCSETACSSCGAVLHHLLTLSPVPEGLPLTGLANLTLATCLSCLGWEEYSLFYRHDEQGKPHALETRTEVPLEPTQPKFVSLPLRETSVRLATTPSRWRWQDRSISNGRENLNRIGGHPCWIQGADYLKCPQCQRTMSFLMQLDSGLPQESENPEYTLEWGSGGIGYGFWCDNCRVSGFFWQCT